MPNISREALALRGALFAATVGLAAAGAQVGRYGFDPFEPQYTEFDEIVETVPTPVPVVIDKALVKPLARPPDPEWAQKVSDAVAARWNDFRICARGTSTAGLTIRARVTVGADGQVESAAQRVYSDDPGHLATLFTYPLGQCVQKKLLTMKFPPPPPSTGRDAELTVALSAPKRLEPEITSSEPTVMGSLDKELIHRVIHANRQQIRYCYEMQLSRFPNLSGKVAVRFVISATGSVASSSVTRSTVGNTELDACVATRVKTWIFPKPRGGGVAIVSYPFIFSPGER